MVHSFGGKRNAIFAMCGVSALPYPSMIPHDSPLRVMMMKSCSMSSPRRRRQKRHGDAQLSRVACRGRQWYKGDGVTKCSTTLRTPREYTYPPGHQPPKLSVDGSSQGELSPLRTRNSPSPYSVARRESPIASPLDPLTPEREIRC